MQYGAGNWAGIQFNEYCLPISELAADINKVASAKER